MSYTETYFRLCKEFRASTDVTYRGGMEHTEEGPGEVSDSTVEKFRGALAHYRTAEHPFRLRRDLVATSAEENPPEDREVWTTFQSSTRIGIPLARACPEAVRAQLGWGFALAQLSPGGVLSRGFIRGTLHEALDGRRAFAYDLADHAWEIVVFAKRNEAALRAFAAVEDAPPEPYAKSKKAVYAVAMANLLVMALDLAPLSAEAFSWISRCDDERLERVILLRHAAVMLCDAHFASGIEALHAHLRDQPIQGDEDEIEQWLRALAPGRR